MTGYSASCPGCGGGLAPVVLDPQTAPWLCTRCHRGWWPGELLADHRVAWRRSQWDFGALTARVAEHVAADVEAAVGRGTSALPEHLPLLGKERLAALAGDGRLSDEFTAEVRNAMEGMP